MKKIKYGKKGLEKDFSVEPNIKEVEKITNRYLFWNNVAKLE